MKIASLVLAAGTSRRLGRPKQLLPYRGTTLLDVTLNRVRGFDIHQRLVAIGGAGAEVRTQVDLDGFDVVDNGHFTSGCSSSIVASLDRIDPAVDGLLLFLGDQPNVSTSAVTSLLETVFHTSPRDSMAVCQYLDALGHPFWFGRSLFGDLSRIHGDKAVWKLYELGHWPVTVVPVDEPIPLDVDTEEDYEKLLAEDAS